MCVAGLLSDWYPNLDALKESCRIASSYNWADVDLSPFQGAVWTLQSDLIAFTNIKQIIIIIYLFDLFVGD